ncbi:MAG: hypothetical protein JXA60_09435 [Candidatus Coatesbacteria bacterium]|nr:hypothetical protein [Candidatus Coatesbacteria bacterium]
MKKFRKYLFSLFVFVSLGMVCTNETDPDDRNDEQDTDYPVLVVRIFGKSARNPGKDVGLGHAEFGIEGKYTYTLEGHLYDNKDVTLKCEMNISELDKYYFCNAYLYKSYYDSTEIWIKAYKYLNGIETFIDSTKHYQSTDTVNFRWKPEQNN